MFSGPKAPEVVNRSGRATPSTVDPPAQIRLPQRFFHDRQQSRVHRANAGAAVHQRPPDSERALLEELDGVCNVTIELVVTDLDGTLWELETAIHDRTRAAILHLLERSLPLLVATGRRVGSTKAPLASVGLAPPAVVLNGALGIDLASGERFHRGGFESTDAAIVLETYEAHGIEPCIYVDHDHHPVWVSPSPSTHPQHLASFGTDVATGDLHDIVDTEHILAFGVLGVDDRCAQRLGQDLAAVGTAHVDRDRQYGGYTVTTAPRAQSKWDGVEAFCARNGLDPGAVLALGDGPNDAELLENAAIAVVPEDAHPSARQRANHIVGCARDGGWADILHILNLTLPG